MKGTLLLALGLALVLNGAGFAQAYSVLLVNDDGWDSPGIQAVFKALSEAGHAVTLVAPATQQSGKGGSMNTDIGGTVEVRRQQPQQWSVASTPGDSVRAGLDIILRDNPPDVVVSGANFGQNVGRPATAQSGTVNAALQAAFRGLPAIAVSTGVASAERAAGFPSTISSFPASGELVVKLLQALDRDGKTGLPAGVVLNVNIPVPYDGKRELRLAQLADTGIAEIVWEVDEDNFSADGGKVTVGYSLARVKPLEEGDDISLFSQGFVTVTPISSESDCMATPEVVTAAIAAINAGVKSAAVAQ